MPQTPDPHSSDNQHPFLTPKGLRLQQQGPRVFGGLPLSLPDYPPERPKRDQRVPAAEVDPFDLSDPGDLPVDNVVPSKRFPRLESLSGTPLREHFKTRLVSAAHTSPLRAIGKLLIQVSRDRPLELASGSAWISGPSTIVTSAHNLYDSNTKTWSQALQFYPGYDYYSDRPQPVCRVTSCYLPRRYLKNPATAYDIAVCHVDRNIGDIVDTQIPMETIGSHELFDQTPVAIVGYPAGSGFDFGKQMWQSIGAYLFGRRIAPGEDYSPAMATSFGAGASGCPWLIQDGPSGRYLAVGVSSGHAKLSYARGQPNLMSLTSPFFGQRMFDQLNDDPAFHEFRVA